MKFIKLIKKNLITFKNKTLYFLKKHGNFLLIIQVSIMIGIETSSIIIPTQIGSVLVIAYMHFRTLQNRVDQLGDHIEAVINDRMIKEYADKFHKRYEVSSADLESEYRESGDTHPLFNYRQIALENPIILHPGIPIVECERFSMDIMVPSNMTPREVEMYVQHTFAEAQERRRVNIVRTPPILNGEGVFLQRNF